MSAAELTDKLHLNQLRNRHVSIPSEFSHEKKTKNYLLFQWYIQATCATQGHGLYEGLDWLSNELAKK